MSKLWTYALFVVGVVALITYWELNHPLSYSKYRGWIAECTAEAATTNPAGSSAKARDCSISYDDWTHLVIPNAPTRDPSLSKERAVKK